MDQYISTYRKDFMWPYVRTLSIITDKQSRESADPRCKCGAEPGGSMPPKEYVGPPEADNYQWSRLGPMAPLLDPKLYPAKVGPPPEFEIMRYDQPNTYLKKLQEKYPYLYNVLQSAPPDEMIRRVNEDRLRTTYQVDYEHIDEHPSGDYEKLLAQAGISSYCAKSPFLRESPPILDCRAQLRPPDYTDPIQPGSDRFAHQAIDDRGNNGNDRGFGKNSGDFVTSGGRNGSSNNMRHEGNGGGRRSGPDAGGGGIRNGGIKSDRGGGNVRNEGSGGGNVRNEGSGGQREGRGSSRNMRHEGNGGGGPDARGGGIRNEGNKVDRGGSNVRNEGSGGQREGGGSRDEGGRGGGGRREEGSSGVRARGAKNEGGAGGDGGGGKSKKSAKVEEDEEASKKPLPAWRSEYQEVIGQTGMDIIRDKLHQHGDRSSGRSFAERIIMKCRA